MRKTIIAACFLLVGCATGPLTADQIAQLTQQIQAYTAAACAFQPTAASVAQLISAFVSGAEPIVVIVNTIGAAICSAPQTQALARRGVVYSTRIVQTPKGAIAVKGVNYGAAK